MFLKISQNLQKNIYVFNKVVGLNRCSFIKKRLWHRCFPVNFAKFQRTPFLKNISGRLLLQVVLTHSNTTLSQEKIYQTLKIPYRPATICWSSRRLKDVFKTCLTIFSVTIFRLPRRLEDVLKTSWKCFEDISQNVLKTSWRRLGRRNLLRWRHLQDVLKTSWRHLEDMSWRRLQDALETNKSKCVYLWSKKSTFNKSISDKSKANPKCID